MIKLDKKTIAGFVAVILVLAGFVYLLYANGFIGYFTDRQRLLNLIKEHRANAAFIFIGFQALQVVAAPVPGEATGFVGGMFFGTGWGMLYSTIGLTLGSWIAFMLARLAGRPLVGMVVKAETIKRYDYVMKHKGMFLAFLMFLVPGFPKDILCYLLGLGHMGQRDFLVVSTTGRLLGTTLLTVGGTLFRVKRYGALFTLFGISLFFILLTMVYREAIERWFRRLRAAQILKHRADRAKLKKDNNN
jgi:uncharacterized membrane protein YdjX (TVP38/TMEM64 family)